MNKLSAEEIKTRLQKLPDWKEVGDTLEKTFTLLSFADVMVFLNEVAQTAEDLDHHPDIDIRQNIIRFVLQTHSLSGITDKDCQLAEKIEAVKTELEGDINE